MVEKESNLEIIADEILDELMGAEHPELTPAEIMVANRGLYLVDDVLRSIADGGEIADIISRIRSEQEQEIYRRLAAGTMREQTALLLLKNVCGREGTVPTALDQLLYGDGQDQPAA